jgi:hypothetical protein
VDQDYVRRFALRVRELYPGCPSSREFEIAEHACRKYSGRVGRSAAAKSLDADPVRLAVIAHIRQEARWEVEAAVQGVLEKWLGSTRGLKKCGKGDILALNKVQLMEGENGILKR